jgi:nitrogen fixation/metabolism regulation signal transduction histidine kinase
MSIRHKQTLIMMLTSSVVLLLACAAVSINEVIAYRKAMVVNLETLGEIVGDNTAAALDFNDAVSATETLSALRAEPNIIGACIYTKDGGVFAKYDRTNDATIFTPPALPREGFEFAGQKLHLSLPIAHKGERIGAVYLESDMRALDSRLEHYASIVGLVFLASLLFAFMLSSRLQRLVSDPILHLVKVARLVAVDKNYAIRAVKQSNDELGQLVDGFNEMLVQIQARDTALQTARDSLEKRVEKRTRELENTHKELVAASRRGGMAEIATNVLHNVGNVLNSVNISTGLIVESVKKSQASSLARVVVLLREHAHDLGTFITQDSRGKHLPDHLARLSEHLIANQDLIVSELDSLRKNVEHIKEIVAMQQSYARVGGVKEMVNIVNLVEDSVCMNESGLSRHRVEVIREFENVPSMSLEKHKILQILVNLVRNAKYACDDSGRQDKRMTVRVANGAGRVKISVIDNGVGIPHENLTRIFNYGFTTRKDGHGFGLHSGALAAKEMGGSLTVHSDGPNQGAAFTLEFPCPSQENPHE